MNTMKLDICLSTARLEDHLEDTPELLQLKEWSIIERLWIFQLDRDGFLVSRAKFPKDFLAGLYIHRASWVGMKDPSKLYYIVTKEYLNRNPKTEYPSQLRPEF